MEIKKLTCPECGANFESDEKVSFCSHCGAKLFFDDGTKTVNYNYKTEDVAKIREIEVNRELELNKRQEEAQNMKKAGKIILILWLVIVGIIAFCFFMANKEENSIKLKEAELQSIVDSIYIDIDARKYDEALIKAKSLYYPGKNENKEKKWNDTRETITKIIEEKIKNKK